MSPQLRPTIMAFLALTALTGLAYPLLVAGLARTAFPIQAAGSLVAKDGRVVGSALIGQSFTDPGDFWGRPSATSGSDGKPRPYNAANSGASSLAASNPEFRKTVAARALDLQAADPTNLAPIPVDLVTASGSGLDPHISPAAAIYQVHRVAKARGIREAEVRALVRSHIERPQFGFLGNPRVNVLKLNLALDTIRPK